MFKLLCKNGINFLHENDLTIPLNSFSDYQNRYSGSVFLLASGTSAVDFPVSQYVDIPFIAMNGSILRLEEENIRPLFYLCTDPAFPRKCPDIAKKGCEQAQHLVMNLMCYDEIHKYCESVLLDKSLYLIGCLNSHKSVRVSERRFAWLIRKEKDFINAFSLLKNKTNSLGFSKNIARGYFGGRTVVWTALQFVYTLGFNKVFIIGMDLNKGGRFYEKDGTSAQPTTIDIDYYSDILPSFRLLSKKLLSKQDNFSVYNLSLNSRLPNSVLPKISLEQMNDLIESHQTSKERGHV
ncbi:MAG: hypothetical protein LBU76_09050 [Azoarcus sp.]|jgi:KDO transferase-3|nr:hypothetical protein [Azoarcus sp.]